jgi:hypothetical protein
MHVLQWIAVDTKNKYELEELDTCKEEAFDSVKSTFESMYSESEGLGGWSDWYIVGGGRYNENPDSQYKEDDHSMVISYGENPELFTKTISNAIDSRIIEFNGYRRNFEEKTVDLNDKLDNYDGTMDYSFELYPLSKLLDMLQGKWDMNSYFYDITNWSTNPKHLLDNPSDSWYLVPVDFHF